MNARTRRATKERKGEGAGGKIDGSKLSALRHKKHRHHGSHRCWQDNDDRTDSFLHGHKLQDWRSSRRRGDDGLSVIDIPDDKKGGWRVEEEFINAIRGIEPITHTNFYDGVRYMEFTDAVTMSIQTGERIQLPL